MNSISQDQIDQILAHFSLKYGADVAEVAFVVPQNGEANSTPYLQVGVLTEISKSRIEAEFEGFEVKVRIVEELRPLDNHIS